MSRKAQLGLDTSALHHARSRRERRPPLAGEHELQLGILLPLEPTQSANFAPANQQMIVRISISSNMFSERRRRVVLVALHCDYDSLEVGG